jgi:hypothetical protein
MVGVGRTLVAVNVAVGVTAATNRVLVPVIASGSALQATQTSNKKHRLLVAKTLFIALFKPPHLRTYQQH